MKVALVNIEPKVENTVYMQIGKYHEQLGDTVEWYSPLFHVEYDKIYCSSIFQFTNKKIVTADMVIGGTGFNVRSKLPSEIEACDLDYSIYPNCKTSYVWFSRGCYNSCPFCVVPTKEGKLRCATPKNLNPNATRISVMDNSFTALPEIAFYDAIDFLKKVNLPVDFECGLDCRIYQPERLVAICGSLKIYHQIRTAWDNPREDLRKDLLRMASVFGSSKIMVYVLIGYWSTPQEDLMRVQAIRELKLDPWVMPYNKQDPYQKAFERWANRHINCVWEDYEYGSWKALRKETSS